MIVSTRFINHQQTEAEMLRKRSTDSLTPPRARRGRTSALTRIVPLDNYLDGSLMDYILTIWPIITIVLGILALMTVLFAANRFESSSNGEFKSTFYMRGRSNSNNNNRNFNVKKLNRQLQSADDILLWAHQNFPPHALVQVTSFGPSGLVILHKLSQLGILPLIPIVTIDTLHLFTESKAYLSLVREFFPDLKELHIEYPLMPGENSHIQIQNEEDFDEVYGPTLWQDNPDRYAYITKVQPMLQALGELQAEAWITGRRQSQLGERTNLQAIEIDETSSLDNSFRRYKINPLVHWSYDDVWKYIKENNIPYNPLYDQGYKSLGDTMTTSKVSPDAPERSGRFVNIGGASKTTECGMHAHLEKIKHMKQQAENEGRTFEMPTLPCPYCIDVTDVSKFDSIVIKGTGNVVIEFYSPMCGACQEFAPVYEELARLLQPISNIQAVRFDVTENDIPQSGIDVGFELQATPQLYLVQHNPTFQLHPYEGSKDELEPIIGWLRSKTSVSK